MVTLVLPHQRCLPFQCSSTRLCCCRFSSVEESPFWDVNTVLSHWGSLACWVFPTFSSFVLDLQHLRLKKKISLEFWEGMERTIYFPGKEFQSTPYWRSDGTQNWQMGKQGKRGRWKSCLAEIFFVLPILNIVASTWESQQCSLVVLVDSSTPHQGFYWKAFNLKH